MAYEYKIGGKVIEFENEPTAQDISEARDYVNSQKVPRVYEHAGIKDIPKFQTDRGSMFEKKDGDGLLKTLGKSMISGIVGTTKLATAPIIASEAAKQREDFVQEQSNILTNLIAEKRRLQNRGQDTSRIDKAMQLLQEDTGQTVEELVPEVNATAGQAFGTFAEGVLDIATGGVASGVAKSGVKVGLKEAAKKGAITGLKEGAKIGAAYGATEGLKEEDDFEGVTTKALIGGAIGGLTGGALGAATGSLSSGVGKYTDKARVAERDLIVKTSKSKERVLKESLLQHADDLFNEDNVNKFAKQRFNFDDDSIKFLRDNTGEIDTKVFDELTDNVRADIKSEYPHVSDAIIKEMDRLVKDAPRKEGVLKSAYVNALESYGIAKPEDVMTITKGSKRVADAEAKILSKNGMGTNDIQLVKAVPQREKATVNKMLDIVKSRLDNPTFVERPEEAISDIVIRKANTLDRARKEVGAKLGEVRKSLKNVSVDNSDALSSFINKLDEQGVIVTPEGLDFSNSRLRNSEIAQKAINSAYSGLNNNLKNNSAHDADIFVSSLKDYNNQKDFTDNAGYAKIIINNLASKLDDSIDSVSPEYSKIKREFAKIASSDDELTAFLGKKFDPTDKKSSSAIAEKIRRLDSNSRANAERVFGELENIASEYGDPKDNLHVLTKIASILESGARLTPRNSLAGQVGIGATSAAKDLLQGNLGSGAMKALSTTKDLLMPDSKLEPKEFVDIISRIINR